MSVSILYFEENKPSDKYSEYKYVFPDIFEVNLVDIYYKGRRVVAAEVGFGIASKIYESNFELHSQLLQFIANRLSNPCVQPILLVFVEGGSMKIDVSIYEITSISIDELLWVFKKKIFNGLFLIRE